MRWALALSFCLAGAGCTEDGRAPSDRDRLWGRAQAREALKARAQEDLSPTAFAERPEVRDRILSMSFEETVARLGPVRFEGRSSFRIRRNQHDLRVEERSTVESGDDGDLRVVQSDDADRLLREAIRVGSDWYVRNEAGLLQTTDYAQRRQLRPHEEAFGPLAETVALVGPAMAWSPSEGRRAGARITVGYRASLSPTAGTIEAPGFDEPLRPTDVRGTLALDAETGAVVDAELTVEAKLPQSGGSLQIRVGHRVRSIEPVALDVSSASEPAARAPVDLKPLEFLERLTRTSTIIGGDEPRDR